MAAAVKEASAEGKKKGKRTKKKAQSVETARLRLTETVEAMTSSVDFWFFVALLTFPFLILFCSIFHTIYVQI
jgi:hypothetical protein